MVNSRIILLSLLLAGCAAKEPIQVEAKPLPVSIPKADTLVMKPVTWQVLDVPKMEKMLADNKDNTDFRIFVLTPDGYKALVYNMIEMKRVIKQQQTIILYMGDADIQNDVAPSK